MRFLKPKILHISEPRFAVIESADVVTQLFRVLPELLQFKHLPQITFNAFEKILLICGCLQLSLPCYMLAAYQPRSPLNQFRNRKYSLGLLKNCFKISIFATTHYHLCVVVFLPTLQLMFIRIFFASQCCSYTFKFYNVLILLAFRFQRNSLIFAWTIKFRHVDEGNLYMPCD